MKKVMVLPFLAISTAAYPLSQQNSIVCNLSPPLTEHNQEFCKKISSDEHRKALLATIPKDSLRKLLFFAALYPGTNEGKIALKRAFDAFPHDSFEKTLAAPLFFEENVARLVALSEPTLFAKKDFPATSQETLLCIDELGKNLPHKTLKGHSARSLKEIEQLEPHEIDLARALLLLEEELSPQIKAERASIEAALDLLALSVLARAPLAADPVVKIRELNHILFDELSLRFPPQSEVEEKVQQFSELSTVLFSRRGICLGASTLYLCLGQRVGLPLSIFTPPGHIFIGFKNDSSLRVIETTARGIDLPLEEYLGTSLRSVPERSLKEVIGMVAFNRASKALGDKEWEKALSHYELAQKFESDEELSQMLAMTKLLLGRKKEAAAEAQKALKTNSPHRVEHDLILWDLNKETLSKESVETILETTKSDPERLPDYIKKLEACMEKDPASLSLPLHLAYCWFSYGKPKEALPLLEKIASSQEAPASIHLFLAELYESRLNLLDSWKEAKKALLLAQAQGFIPKTLKKCILSLQRASPNCEDLPDLVPYLQTRVATYSSSLGVSRLDEKRDSRRMPKFLTWLRSFSSLNRPI